MNVVNTNINIEAHCINIEVYCQSHNSRQSNWSKEFHLEHCKLKWIITWPILRACCLELRSEWHPIQTYISLQQSSTKMSSVVKSSCVKLYISFTWKLGCINSQSMTLQENFWLHETALAWLSTILYCLFLITEMKILKPWTEFSF